MARSARRPKTPIASIFGQIECVVAQAMVDEGKFTKIEVADIPPAEQHNEKGVLAYFAVVMPAEHQQEFDARVRSLRA